MKQKTFNAFIASILVLIVLICGGVGGYFVYRNVTEDAEQKKEQVTDEDPTTETPGEEEATETPEEETAQA